MDILTDMKTHLSAIALWLLLATGCSMQPVERAQPEAFYTQQVDWADCGAAVTVMMTQFAGKPVTLGQAKVLAGRNNWWWTTNVTAVLGKLGIPYTVSDNLSLLADGNKGMAVIIQYLPGIPTTNHMVFLRGLNGGLIKVHDPSEGTYWMSVKTLESRRVKGFGLIVRNERR